MGAIKLPIGLSNFEDIRKNNYYYVDKTYAISELIEEDVGTNSILFTRPRRFGKTTLQSMFRSFFDIRKDSRELFHGLKIMKEKKIVDEWMNKYPVIYLSLREIDGNSYEIAEGMLKREIGKIFKEYSFILEDELFADDRKSFSELMTSDSSAIDLMTSLALLSRLLHKHYGKQVIILIDEYDVPLDKASDNGYYTEMLNLIRALFYSVLKDNNDVKKAILTGCLRISKESLFTGLNNLAVYSVTGIGYETAFGFTGDEVDKLLSAAGFSEKKDVIRKWYDGYCIGSEKLYTPWDVILYVSKLMKDKDAEPDNFWANSSGNNAIRKLIDITEASVSDDFTALIEGNAIEKKISETLTYSNVYSNENNIWSLLLSTGYLTIDGKYNPNKETSLKLPNEEIRNLFAESADEWFTDFAKRSNRDELFSAIWNGNAEALSSIISRYLSRSISYYDYIESYYHAFLVGLLSGSPYPVKSNREQGEGRPDITIGNRPENKLAIFEIKRAHAISDVPQKLDEAVKQIRERHYSDTEDYDDVICYAIVFYRKKAFARKV